MPFALGVFSLVAGNPVVTGTIVSSSWANNTLSDIGTGLSTALLKDGTQAVTADITFSGFKATNLGTPTVTGDAAVFGKAVTFSTVTPTGGIILAGGNLTSYLEGGWTPVVTIGATVSAIAGTFAGESTRVGRLVVAQYYLAFSNRGSGTGDVLITNLPYAADSSVVQRGGGGGVADFSGMTSTMIYMSAHMNTNTTIATLKGLTVAATSMSTLQGSDLSNTTLIEGTLMYNTV